MPDLLERLQAALSDSYAVESEIGRGGMATVYLAEDLKHRRKVAIKVLRPGLAVTLAADRFLNEIQIAAGLNHPHILSLIDSGEADGLPYYVMPYVEGESLRDRLDREGELPVEESVRIAVEVADGLHHAHERGVVHRDIKPGNVLLSGKHAVVADFGIARAVTAAQEGRMTGTGLGVGTPLYASPEQATAAETLDGRTDVYSLGCVLYEMLTGDVPLTAATPQAVQARRLVETPAPIHPQRETVPPLLDQVVAKALARRPADRWESAEAFGQALKAATMQTTPVDQVMPRTRGDFLVDGRPGANRWPFGVLIFLAVAIFLSVILIANGASWLSPDVFQITSSGYVPVTNRPGLEFQPSLSPDGGEVAYVEGPIHSTSIVVRNAREVGTGESRVVEDLDGYNLYPTWTPDGSSLRFWNCANRWRSQPGCEWKQVGGRGGAVRGLGVPGRDRLAWSPDGSRVVFAEGSRRIYAMSAAGGEPELLAEQPSSAPLPHSFVWSPDGRTIAYASGNLGWRTSSNVTDASIWLVAAEGGTPVAVTDRAGLNVSPQWLADSRHLLFVSDRDGARGIYVVEVNPDGAVDIPRPVAGAVEPHSISVSADGKRLAYSRYTVRQNVWSIPVAGPGTVSLRRDLAAAVPITSGNQVIEGFDLSPDGEWIAFDSDRRGEFDIYRQRLAGGEPELVADIEGHAYSPVWSPNGSEIAFHGGSQGDGDVFVVPAAGGSPTRLTDSLAQDVFPSWSPDGLTIVYRSYENEEGLPGGYRLWKASRERVGGSWGPAERVSERPCTEHSWVPDGRELLCVTGEAWALLSLDGAERGTLTRPAEMTAVHFPRFSRDRSRIYFRGTHEDGRDGLWWIPAGGGKPRLAVGFDDPSVGLVGDLEHYNDRAVLVLDETESDIWVMDLDW
jgi:serine/threonine-protein kinase